MAYKKNTIHLIIRIALILAVLTILSRIILNPDKLFSILILVIILIIQIIELIKFELKSFRTLENVLNSIEFEYQPVRFTKSLPKSMEGFYQSLNKILDLIQRKKAENEVQLLFLGELLKHIKTGIISISEDQKIELANESALKILGIENLVRLDQIKTLHPNFYQEIINPDKIESNIVEISTAGNIQKLNIQISHFISQGKKMKLISFQDIRSQIELKEMEAWHQLIRTLGHEILNSVTPISSMTETSIMLLEKPDQTPKLLHDLSDENLDKIRNALKTINRRSIGLLEFINNYRKLTRMPVPNFEPVNLSDLVKHVLKLMHADFEKEQVEVLMEMENSKMMCDIDRSMIEQVLINMLRNAIQAMEGIEKKMIRIKLMTGPNENPMIQIIDNGKGITDDLKSKIFIPFFTTKEKGSGIGLSLSRQIMQLHGGSINYQSNNKNETVFCLTFK
ncbi:MAG: GHKL domain-containing protein [Bacteroidetes bacterium]|nr:GHKL domain-containing protein [Bacteroidota bacterium]